MITFVGEYAVKQDDKGRLVFPAPLKAQAMAYPDNRYVVQKSPYHKCLVIYPLSVWAKRVDDAFEDIDIYEPEGSRFWLAFNRGTEQISPDEKTGRIMIKKKLLEQVGIGKEAVFAGVKDVIYLWSVEEFEASQMSDEEYADLMQKLLANKKKKKIE